MRKEIKKITAKAILFIMMFCNICGLIPMNNAFSSSNIQTTQAATTAKTSASTTKATKKLTKAQKKKLAKKYTKKDQKSMSLSKKSLSLSKVGQVKTVKIKNGKNLYTRGWRFLKKGGIKTSNKSNVGVFGKTQHKGNKYLQFKVIAKCPGSSSTVRVYMKNIYTGKKKTLKLTVKIADKGNAADDDDDDNSKQDPTEPSGSEDENKKNDDDNSSNSSTTPSDSTKPSDSTQSSTKPTDATQTTTSGGSSSSSSATNGGGSSSGGSSSTANGGDSSSSSSTPSGGDSGSGVGGTITVPTGGNGNSGSNGNSGNTENGNSGNSGNSSGDNGGNTGDNNGNDDDDTGKPPVKPSDPLPEIPTNPNPTDPTDPTPIVPTPSAIQINTSRWHFENLSKEYNGHIWNGPTLCEVPENVGVHFVDSVSGQTINVLRDAGQYTRTAYFSVPEGYAPVDPISVNFEILPITADISFEYDSLSDNVNISTTVLSDDIDVITTTVDGITSSDSWNASLAGNLGQRKVATSIKLKNDGNYIYNGASLERTEIFDLSSVYSWGDLTATPSISGNTVKLDFYISNLRAPFYDYKNVDDAQLIINTVLQYNHSNLSPIARDTLTTLRGDKVGNSYWNGTYNATKDTISFTLKLNPDGENLSRNASYYLGSVTLAAIGSISTDDTVQLVNNSISIMGYREMPFVYRMSGYNTYIASTSDITVTSMRQNLAYEFKASANTDKKKQDGLDCLRDHIKNIFNLLIN